MTFPERSDVQAIRERTGTTTWRVVEDLRQEIAALRKDFAALEDPGLEWTDVQANHGAVGDGSTDDTAALQEAFDAVQDGGQVYFPQGTYKISDTLQIQAPISIFGMSKTWSSATGMWGKPRIDASAVDPSKTVIDIQSTTDDGFEQIVQLESLSIFGNDATGTGNLIDVQNVAILYIKNCLCKNAPNHVLNIIEDVERLFIYETFFQKKGDSQFNGDCLHAGPDSDGEAALNMPILVDFDTSHGEHGFWWDNEGASDTVLPGIFDRCGFNGGGEECVYITSKGDIHMSQCWFENGGSDGTTSAPAAYFAGGRLYRIENCYFAGNGHSNFASGDPITCHIDGAARNNIIGCYFDSPGADPSAGAAVLKISGGQHNTFVGNTLVNGDGRAMYLDDSDYSEAESTTLEHWTFTGNFFSGYDAIRVATGNNNYIVISDNTMVAWGNFISGIDSLDDTTTTMVGNTWDNVGGAAGRSQPNLRLGQFHFNDLSPKNDATPDVGEGNHFITINDSDTTITDFDNGTPGHPVWLLIGDDYTTIDFTQPHLHGNDGYKWKAHQGDLVHMVLDTNGEWHCQVPQRDAEKAWDGEVFADGDTTPSVASNKRHYWTDNSSLTRITAFDDVTPGQWFILHIGDNNTTLGVEGNQTLRARGDVDMKAYNAGGDGNYVTMGDHFLCIHNTGGTVYLYWLDQNHPRGMTRVLSNDAYEDYLGNKVIAGTNMQRVTEIADNDYKKLRFDNLIKVRESDPDSPSDGQMWIVN